MPSDPQGRGSHWAGVVAASRETPPNPTSDFLDAKINLGYALQATGDRDGAVAAWRDALCAWETQRLRNDIGSREYFAAAHLLASCGDKRFSDPRRAIDLAMTAVRLARTRPLDPLHDSLAKLAIGQAYYQMGDWEAAATVAETLPSAHLDDRYRYVEGWLLYALVLSRTGKADQARPWHAKAVDWLDRTRCRDPLLCRMRAEADGLLGAPNAPTPQAGSRP